MNQQAELIRRQTEAAAALETKLQLAREAQEATPQQQAPPNSSLRTHGERARAPGQRTASCRESPPAGSACREEHPQYERQQARSPRRHVTDDQVLLSRERVPSAAHRPSDVHSATRHSFHPPNELRKQESQDHRQRHPDDAGRRRNSHGSRYEDGHDRYEGDFRYYNDTLNHRLARSTDH